MSKPKANIKKVLDTLEQEVKKGAEEVVQNFTSIPAEILAQVTGKEVVPPQNYTDIDTSLIEAQKQAESQDELDEVRQRLASFGQPANNRHFNEFRAAESQAVEERRQEKQARKEEELRIEQAKLAEEEERRRINDQAPIPTGKIRGNIYSKKKPQKTAENRPAFGKM